MTPRQTDSTVAPPAVASRPTNPPAVAWGFAATAPISTRAAATAEASTKPTATRATMTSARSEGTTSSASASTCASPPSSSAPPDNYFKFTDKHQRYLVSMARRHASALVVDALHDPSKWRFLTELKPTSSLSDGVVSKATGEEAVHAKYITPAQRGLEVFELHPQAIDRVACVAPRLAADPEQLAPRAHTLLARTRVRGKLDEFMAWMTSKRRPVHQGMMHTLHEGVLQHCDVFSGFEADNSPREELEQYALKYFVVEPTASAATFDAARPATASTTSTTQGQSGGATQSVVDATKRTLNFLRRRKESSDSQDPVQQQEQQSKVRQQWGHKSKSTPDERMHFCVGEYSTVRHGLRRTDRQHERTEKTPADTRIGIISYHSVEDQELLQLCNSVAKKTTPRELAKCTSRTLMQYSGVVVYPVASDDDDGGAEYLEVVVKMSCFDARGLSALKRATMFSYVAGYRNLAHTLLVMRLRASPFLTATHWVADERRKCCLVCQQRFSSLRRRHHCRLCGEVTCSKCSAVHQVRLVKEAKASLRICLLCVQGEDRPKWKEKVLDEEIAEQEQEQERNSARLNSQSEDAEDPLTEDVSARETEPMHLLDFSLLRDLQKPQSPTSTVTDSSSPVDPLMQSHGPSVSSGSAESEPGLHNTIRDFHDSAFNLPMMVPPSKTTLSVLTDETTDLHESMMSFDDDDEDEDDQSDIDEMLQELAPVQETRASSGLLSTNLHAMQFYGEPEKEDRRSSIRRISNFEDGEELEEEDEDDARLQALAAYGLLDADGLVDGVMPEDLALQTIVKEAAQYMECAIATIGFVDASRDMVSATYSASPLCQVPRGVLPKQYSPAWEVMQRCSSTLLPKSGDVGHVTILDAAKDPALRKNPFVLDSPFVRFLVGIPIRAWNGVVIGAMMIADIQSRAGVTAEQLLALTSHVALVETWLENKRNEIATQRLSARGGNPGNKLHSRLAEMLNTSYQTTLELQMRGMQMKQRAPGAHPKLSPTSRTGTRTSTSTSTSTSIKAIRHVLY